MSVGSLSAATRHRSPDPAPGSAPVLVRQRLAWRQAVSSRRTVEREHPSRSAIRCCVQPARRQRLARCCRDSEAQQITSSGSRISASSSAASVVRVAMVRRCDGEKWGGISARSLSAGSRRQSHAWRGRRRKRKRSVSPVQWRRLPAAQPTAWRQ